MKHVLYLFALLSVSVAITSCQCRGPFGGARIVCSNGGTCNDGVCDCLKGYYGTNCTEIDSCDLLDVFCERGDCDNGECFCDVGWQGDSCNFETRSPFIAYYAVTEYCFGLDTVGGHQIWITRDPVNGDGMFIHNLFSYDNFFRTGYFSKIEATAVIDSTAIRFEMPNQRPDGGKKSISGSGFLTIQDTSTTNITINYINQNGSKKPDTCILRGVRIPDPQ